MFVKTTWKVRSVATRKMKDMGAERLEAGEKVRDRYWLPGALVRNVTVCMLEGDWLAARKPCDRALEINDMDPRSLGTRLLLEHMVGDSNWGQEFVERLMEANRLISPVEEAGGGNGYTAFAIPIAALTTGDMTGISDAQHAARTILSSDNAAPIYSRMAHTGLGVLAMLSGDGAEAREHYNALMSAKGHLIAVACMSADRLLGLLCQTMGNLDQATGHFEDALAFCRKAGYRPELAWTCCDYADTLRERNGEGGRAKAVTLLDESLAISSELGMRPLMERVLSRREILRA